MIPTILGRGTLHPAVVHHLAKQEEMVEWLERVKGENRRRGDGGRMGRREIEVTGWDSRYDSCGRRI